MQHANSWVYNSCAVKDTNSVTDSNLQTNQHFYLIQDCAQQAYTEIQSTYRRIN